MKHFFLLLFSVILFCSVSKAQKAFVDSILKIYPEQKGVEKMKSRNNLALFYRKNMPDSALFYVNESLNESRKLKNDSIYISALTIKGVVMGRLGKIDSSRYYHKESIRIAELFGHIKEKGNAFNNIGLLEWKDGNFNLALDYFFSSLEIHEKCEDYKGITISLNNIGLIYMERDQYEKAMSYFHQSLALKNKHGIAYDKSGLYLNMGISSRQLERVDSAKHYFNKALTLFEKQGDLLGIAKIKNGLSTVAFQENNYELALKYILESFEIDDRLANINLIIDHINMCAIYYSLGQYKKGIENGNAAQEYVDLGYSVEIARRIYIFRALNYAALGDRDNALIELDKYEDAMKEKFSEKNANAISELEVRYETQKKEYLLLQEKNKTALQDVELAKSKLEISSKNNLLILLISIVIVGLLLTLYLTQKNKQKRQLEKEKALQIERRNNLQLIIQSQEDDRKRISKDLHDGVGQQLSGLKMAWTSLSNELQEKSPETAIKIEQLTAQLSQSTEEIRAISHVMMPKSLQELGLVPALENLLENTFSMLPIKYSFEEHNTKQRFAEKVEICFYRIAQELINNCLKHADASLISVQLIKSKSYLTLLVEDNGKGMNIQSGQGHGIKNITTRINSINGEVNYENSPTGGTLVTVRTNI